MNKCLKCNKEFEGRPERPNKYCSHECHISHSKVVTDVICVVCGVKFIGNPSRQCCSLKCVHAQMRLPEKPCSKCGKMFAPEKKVSKYCSWGCMCLDRSDRNATPPDPVEKAKWISLTKQKFALIDEEDYDKVITYSWHAHEGRSTWYARSRKTIDGVRYVINLHHLVMGIPPGEDKFIDHIDQNGLNCRKSNLRISTESQNRMNTLKKKGQTHYKGVAVLPNGKFKATICANHLHKYLGMFNDATDAALAYDAEARKMHGECGRYNFPINNERPALACDITDALRHAVVKYPRFDGCLGVGVFLNNESPAIFIAAHGGSSFDDLPDQFEGFYVKKVVMPR